MAIIDVKVIEPDGTTWNAQLDNSESVEDIVLSLLPQLDLPTDISYQLIRKATGQALYKDKTLATLGIKAGEILLIKPVQNKAFMRIKKALYEKAEDYVVEESWELAKEQLDKLFRLEPDHPDREELRQKIEANFRVASQSMAQAAASGAGDWVFIVIVVVSLVAYALYQKGVLSTATNQARNVLRQAQVLQYKLTNTESKRQLQSAINRVWRAIEEEDANEIKNATTRLQREMYTVRRQQSRRRIPSKAECSWQMSRAECERLGGKSPF